MAMNRRNAAVYILLFLAWIGAISCSSLRELVSMTDREQEIPTAHVVREPVAVKIYTQGELQPVRAEPVIAPPVSGGTLQIVYIAKNGARIKKGDVVVEFDPSEQEYNLEQAKSQLEEADQKIKKAKIDQAVRTAQEKVTLLNAESAVRRAELKIKGNSLLGRIEARKNEIAFEEAKRKLEQQKQDIRSKAVSDTASLEAQMIARNRAMMMMQRAQDYINNMILRAPMDGIVVMGQNIQAILGGGIIISLTDIPEYKKGDQARAGETVAQIQDVDSVEIKTKVLETDRGNLTPGQPAEIFLDFRPTRPFTGKIKSLAPSANSRSSISSALALLESLSSRTFDAVLEFEPGEEPLKLGTTARIVIQGKNVDDALSVPRQAIFQKEGRPVVYVKGESDWRTIDVQIKYLTENRAILDGIDEGTEVALVNPEQGKGGDSAEANPLMSLRPGVNR